MVPRFLDALSAAGATPTRVSAYVTRPGVSPDDIGPEAALMRAGVVEGIVFTSTAEAQGLLLALGGRDVLASLVAEQGVTALVSLYVFFWHQKSLAAKQLCTSHGCGVQAC